jgi:hypothetical protein
MNPEGIDRACGPRRAGADLAAWYTQGVSDWLGDRLLLYDNTDAPSFELLRLRAEFGADGEFLAALRRRLQELNTLDSRYFLPVRGVERLADANRSIAVVFEHTPNIRFSSNGIGSTGRLPDPRTVVGIAHQLMDATAMLHRIAPTVSHGILEPHRLAVTPHGHLAVLDHVFGSAVGGRQWRLRQSATPQAAGAAASVPAFGPGAQRGDLFQIGRMILSWLTAADAPSQPDAAALSQTLAHVHDALRGSLPAAAAPQFVAWLARVLQLEPDTSFPSAVEAFTALRECTIDQSQTGERLAALVAPAVVASIEPPVPASGTLGQPEAPGTPIAVEPDAVPHTQSRPEALDIFPREKDLPRAVNRGSNATPPRHAAPPRSSPLRSNPLPVRPAAATTFTHLNAATADLRQLHGGNYRRRPSVWVTASLAAVAALEAAVIGLAFVEPPATQKPVDRTFTIRSQPSGVNVLVDGVAHGPTPLDLSLDDRDHAITLDLPTTPSPADVLAALDSGPPVAASPRGQLQVDSSQFGADVTLDGERRGITPLEITNLTAGPHTVVVRSRGRSIEQLVTIRPGATTSVFIRDVMPTKTATE